MVEIIPHVYSIDDLDHPIPHMGIVSYLIEEKDDPNDLTLIDTCFLSDLSKLESAITNEGFEIKNIRRIILTHVHPDHVEAANEIRNRSGAKIYSHWIERAYLAQKPKYQGPPTKQTFHNILQECEVKIDEIVKKFGKLELEPIIIDEQLKDGDHIGKSLQVIHTPGHTPGHISLYHKEYGIIFGGDFLFNSVTGREGLFIPPTAVTIDYVTAIVSAKRVSGIKFDKLLLGHQSAPILEDAQKAVDKVVTSALEEQMKITKH